MLLYKTQPQSDTQNTIINLALKEKLVRSLAVKFRGQRIEYNDAVTLLTDAGIIDGLITQCGYMNILVLPSFVDDEYKKLRDRNYRPINSAGDHLLPIVHMANESKGKMTVALPKNQKTYLRGLYETWGVNVVESESLFKIDQDFRVNTKETYDCVVLLGCGATQKGKFKIEDVKKRLRKYTIPNFTLIDVYRNVPAVRTITGGTEDISTRVERMIECVNTPNKVYDKTTRINPKADYMLFARQKLMMYRLALNLEKVNEYYRVY